MKGIGRDNVFTASIRVPNLLISDLTMFEVARLGVATCDGLGSSVNQIKGA
jgi:hypothetical protein